MFYIIIIHINLFWSLYVNNYNRCGSIGACGSNQPEAAFGKRKGYYIGTLIFSRKKILATGNGRCNLTNRYADGYDEVKAFSKI